MMGAKKNKVAIASFWNRNGQYFIAEKETITLNTKIDQIVRDLSLSSIFLCFLYFCRSISFKLANSVIVNYILRDIVATHLVLPIESGFRALEQHILLTGIETVVF